MVEIEVIGQENDPDYDVFNIEQKLKEMEIIHYDYKPVKKQKHRRFSPYRKN